jgi:hypothetical protein
MPVKKCPIIFGSHRSLIFAPATGEDQCDQIGPIFAPWAIVYFELLFENDRSSQNFLLLFLFCVNLDRKVFGYFLGDFFTNSFGHPGADMTG